jgi:hypothetical protein
MSRAATRKSAENRFIPQKPSKRASRRRSNAQMWWAPRPWLGRLGIYRFVCLVGHELFVGVATQEAFFWVEAAQALQPFEAKGWTVLHDQSPAAYADTTRRDNSSARLACTSPSAASVRTRRSR